MEREGTLAFYKKNSHSLYGMVYVKPSQLQMADHVQWDGNASDSAFSGIFFVRTF